MRNDGQTGSREKPVISFKPARRDQYDPFFDLMAEQADDYLEASVRLIGLSMSQFREKFVSVGEVYAIYADGFLAGFYWIEKRPPALHIHALILKTEYQGRGIGGSTLEQIENHHGTDMEFLELGVYRHNEDAVRLYKRHGYRKVKTLDKVDFYIMRKQVPGDK